MMPHLVYVVLEHPVADAIQGLDQAQLRLHVQGLLLVPGCGGNQNHTEECWNSLGMTVACLYDVMGGLTLG